eukprot:GAFH01001126.1.p3 GENE.GAFH01001126.1~~GAFH01001126.1.p3  ORF type:complete len:202 (-),score=23.42 GAFH01001126.1:69-674(-)
MSINVAKSEYLTNDPERSPVRIGGSVIPAVRRGEAIRYLGVWLDEELSLEAVAQLLNECVTPVVEFMARNVPVDRRVLEEIAKEYNGVARKASRTLGVADACDMLYVADEAGGVGIKHPVDVHDQTVLVQLLGRIVDRKDPEHGWTKMEHDLIGRELGRSGSVLACPEGRDGPLGPGVPGEEAKPREGCEGPGEEGAEDGG